jgi:hypothetical protein
MRIETGRIEKQIRETLSPLAVRDLSNGNDHEENERHTCLDTQVLLSWEQLGEDQAVRPNAGCLCRRAQHGLRIRWELTTQHR